MSAVLRAGYKQTEVGLIPEDWKEATLASLVEKGSRITYGVVKPGSNDIDGVLFIRGGDIFSGRIHEGQLRRIPKEVSEQYKRTLLSGGEVLISLVGYPGEAALVPQHLRGANIARQVALVRLSKSLAPIPDFVCKYLQSDLGRRQLLKEAIGSAQQVINLRDIQKVSVALPTATDEQRAIAAALSDVDALLGGLDRLIAKKQGFKVAAMQQLLTGKTRLPGFSGEWEVKRLGDLVQIRKGQLITSTTLLPGDIPVIAGGKQPAYFHASANRFGRTVTISASGASAGYVALYDEPIFASDCSTISESEAYCLDFVFYQLVCKQQVIYKAQTGGAQPHIHAKDLNPLLFAFPALPEQTAIAAILFDLDTEVSALQARRSKTQALKQAMMQALLTGRTRLI